MTDYKNDFIFCGECPIWTFLQETYFYFFQIDFNGDNVPEVNSAFPPLL